MAARILLSTLAVLASLKDASASEVCSVTCQDRTKDNFGAPCPCIAKTTLVCGDSTATNYDASGKHLPPA